MTTHFSVDSHCKECASCGASDHVVDIVIMEHGFQGVHTNLDAIASSIVKGFDARHSGTLWRHLCPRFSESTRSSTRPFASASARQKENEDQNRMDSPVRRRGFGRHASFSPSCRCSSSHYRSPFSASLTADTLSSPNLPLCPHHLLILNNPGNDGWKSLWSIQKCSARLISFVLEKIGKYLAELESIIKKSSQKSSRIPYSSAKPKKVENVCCVPSSNSSEGCDLGNTLFTTPRSEECNPDYQDNDPQRRQTVSLSSCPVSNGALPESVEGVASASFSSGFKVKLVFHFVGFSMGGIILRAAMPAMIKKIEEKYLFKMNARSFKGGEKLMGCFCSSSAVAESNRQSANVLKLNTLSEEGNDTKGQGWISERTIQYSIIWKSFFSLSCPHLGSRIPHPRWRKSYKIVDKLKKIFIVPNGVLDLLLRSSYLEKELLKPDYLLALKRIEKKYFIGSLTDPTVWNYSSCFLLPPLERIFLEGWIPAGEHTTVLHVKVHQSVCRQLLEKKMQSRKARRNEKLSHLENNSLNATENRRGSSENHKRRKPTIHSKKTESSIKLTSGNEHLCFSRETSSAESGEFPPDCHFDCCFQCYQEDSYSQWINFSKEEDTIRTANRKFFTSIGLRPSSNFSDLLSNGVTVLQGNVEVSRNLEGKRELSPVADEEKHEIDSKRLFRIIERPPNVEAVGSLSPKASSFGSFSSFSESLPPTVERKSAPVVTDWRFPNTFYPFITQHLSLTDKQEELQHKSWISEARWPEKILPRERCMAEKFLKGIGSIEVHLLDMQRTADQFLDSLVNTAVEAKKLNDLNYDLLLYVLTLVYGNAHCAVLSDETGNGVVPPRYVSSLDTVHCKGKSNQKSEFGSTTSRKRSEIRVSPRSPLVAYEYREEKVVLPFSYPSEFITYKILEGDR